MLRRQLRQRGIHDRRVLEAMGKRAPRTLCPGRTSAPMPMPTVPCRSTAPKPSANPTSSALMTEALELSGDELVLEIGTGSGYQTAILAELAREVVSIERHAALTLQAEAVLAELGLFERDAVDRRRHARLARSGPLRLHYGHGHGRRMSARAVGPARRRWTHGDSAGRPRIPNASAYSQAIGAVSRNRPFSVPLRAVDWRTRVARGIIRNDQIHKAKQMIHVGMAVALPSLPLHGGAAVQLPPQRGNNPK